MVPLVYVKLGSHILFQLRCRAYKAPKSPVLRSSQTSESCIQRDIPKMRTATLTDKEAKTKALENSTLALAVVQIAG